MNTQENLTKSQKESQDVSALLRARNPLLWITTKEEARVELHLIAAAESAGYIPMMWDVAQGVTDLEGKPQYGGEQLNDPGAALTNIRNQSKSASGKRTVWIMRDLPTWLQGPPGATPLRQLRNLAKSLPGTPREQAQAIIVLSPSGDVPPELSNHAAVIEWPLPDRAEIGDILDEVIETLPDEVRAEAAPNGQRDAAIDAAVGLTGEEVQACYAKSLVQFRRIDPAEVAKEKKRVIAREKVLEWYDPIPGGLEAVGGLEALKGWLVSRSSAYSPEARSYGLPAPKGALVGGIPGTGKSLIAKAIATAWQVPLLRLDLGALKSKFLGESEGNIRKAFKVIEAIGRCVVWIDEIEKALQGSTSGAADGGVSADALGTLLSWMQERKGEAFVIATANDVESLPPELLRKGRFDEVWWVDLPTQEERKAIVEATLKQYGRKVTDLNKVAAKTEGFTGSEIAALVPDALFKAFADGQREITSKDLLEAVDTTTPMSKTAKEKIEKLRTWAAGRARSASGAPMAQAEGKKSRQLDM